MRHFEVEGEESLRRSQTQPSIPPSLQPARVVPKLQTQLFLPGTLRRTPEPDRVLISASQPFSIVSLLYARYFMI